MDRKVLLLNTCLTTRKGEAGAHSEKGWEQFTSTLIESLNNSEKPIVFLSWGKWAHKVTANIDRSKHLVIQTSHPMPLGARQSGTDYKALWESNCFTDANRFLIENGREAIDWQNTTGKIDQMELF